MDKKVSKLSSVYSHAHWQPKAGLVD